VRGTVNMKAAQWFFAHPGRGPGLRRLTGNHVCASDWLAKSTNYAHYGYREDYASCMFSERNPEGRLARTNWWAISRKRRTRVGLIIERHAR
jgi:hypothetical protein